MPEELKDAASAFWAHAGKLLNELIAKIADTLDLPAEALTAYSEPCGMLGSERTATMLRLFRYEGMNDREIRTVAEGMAVLCVTEFNCRPVCLDFDLLTYILGHRDLGLLSLVIGDTPGLEVWDRYAKSWFEVERSYFTPAASLLGGRQLERLSNGRYRSGGHRVMAYPKPLGHETDPTPSRKKFRYSIVFVLRAHHPVPIDSDNLTTDITGKFPLPIKDITAHQLFRDLESAHYNVNTGIQEREEQRRKLASKSIAMKS